MELFDLATEAAQFIRSKLGDYDPKTLIVTGTGLNSILDGFKIILKIPYQEIPHFPEGTVKSHGNELVLCLFKDNVFLVMNGRFHFYEGFDMNALTFPIRAFQMLNIENVVFTNASGGLQAHYKEGDIKILKDHINLMPINPLRGIRDERLGVRFPDMSEVYNKTLRKKLIQLAENQNIKLEEAVYACWQGPSLETPAEYKFLNLIGADVVGMSTIPEVIVARQAEMKVVVLSIVTNICYPPNEVDETDIDAVIKAAQGAIPNLKILLKALLDEL